MNHLVNKPMFQKEFRTLEPFGKILSDSLFYNPGTCKTNQCPGFCNDNISQTSKRGHHADGHLHVGFGDERAFHHKLDVALRVRRGQQQTAQELARYVPSDHGSPAAQPPGPDMLSAVISRVHSSVLQVGACGDSPGRGIDAIAGEVEADVSGFVLTEEGLVAGEAVVTEEGIAAHRLVATEEGMIEEVVVAAFEATEEGTDAVAAPEEEETPEGDAA